MTLRNLTGNILIGGTFTDSGERLQVTGDVKIKGSGNTSATTALTVQNSDASSILSLLNNGEIQVGNNAGRKPYISTYSSETTQNIAGRGLALVFNGGPNLPSPGILFTSSSNATYTSSTANFVVTYVNFAPTSGTAVFNNNQISSVINQTGGANGITRGLYVNPTLTAAADWRSIEWSNNSGWGLYGAGTASNYINGNLLLGSATSTGEKLQVTGTMRVTATGFNNTTFANAGQAVYNTYAPTGYSSWIIGVETQYFLGYSGRNILVFSRDRNHTTGGIDNNYIGFGHLGPTANVDIASSSTARASLRIRSGVAPTSPNDGDIWYDGTNVYMRVGTTTKTFTLV
jgi:hypothetical protein